MPQDQVSQGTFTPHGHIPDAIMITPQLNFSFHLDFHGQTTTGTKAISDTTVTEMLAESFQTEDITPLGGNDQAVHFESVAETRAQDKLAATEIHAQEIQTGDVAPSGDNDHAVHCEINASPQQIDKAIQVRGRDLLELL
jgi:hypothetical protein